MLNIWKLRQIIKNIPNDTELGRKIRTLYHEENIHLGYRLKKIQKILKQIENTEIQDIHKKEI